MEEVVSAFTLWNKNLITDDVFFGIMRNLKYKTITYPITNTISNGITPKQKDYIIKLKIEGKIPKDQRLDISKADAQALIKSALEHDPQIKHDESHAPKIPENGIPSKVLGDVSGSVDASLRSKADGGEILGNSPSSDDDLYAETGEEW